MKKFILTVIGLCFLLTSHAQAQSFEALVNRNTVPEGETFLLTLELANAKTQSTPDLSALSADFTTYSVSNSFRTAIVNGQASQSQQWNLVMMPNKTGKLTIPSLKLDNLETKPIVLTVVPAGEEMNAPSSNKADAPNNRFAMSGMVDNKSPYVQEQVIYTLKLVDHGGLQGEEPYFEANNDWIIKNLGAPVINSQVINGQTIRELVFKYALFAQKSGKLTIPAAKFRGFYLTKSSRSDPFAQFFNDDVFLGGFGMADVFATKNSIFLSSKPIDINVKPAVQGTAKWWLPAKEVKLFAEFNPQQQSFKVGEAITRDIYLQATGIIDSQLPEIKFTPSNGLKQYPEKPLVQMKVQDGQVVALKKIANVYIPNISGEITLPEIRVPWFNVTTNQAEVAKIPAQKIMVLGEATTPTAAPAPSTTQTAPTAAVDIAKPMPQVSLYMLLGGAFVLGLLISFVLMKILTSNKKKLNHSKMVVQAAKQNDLRVLRDALIIWAKSRFNDERFFSLNDIDEKIKNREFHCLLDKLDEILYSGATQDWNVSEFISVFEKINKQKVRKIDDADLLPKLYK